MNYKLVHHSLHEYMSLHANPVLWAEALAYLKRTGDVSGWRVMLYGA
jgi:hypothetical protein